MKDVALAASVNQSTVSRVLNDRSLTVPIAPETRQRVLDAATRLHYRPNPFARALRGGPTMLVGAIVREITDPFFAGAVEAISLEARSRGYNVVLGHAHSRAAEALALAAVLEARQCDALFVLGDMGDYPRLLEDLHLTQVPVVGLWQGSELAGIPTVNVENRSGISEAVAHLKDLGHSRVAFVGGPPLGDIRERREAFLKAIEPLTLANASYVQQVPNTPDGGIAALRTLMALPEAPTAIVGATDVLAMGMLRASAELGVRVPDELSVVGFDDVHFAAYLVPALTTIRMPIAEMAAAAVELALTLAGRSAGPPVEVRTFVPELIVRESTASPGPRARR